MVLLKSIDVAAQFASAEMLARSVLFSWPAYFFSQPIQPFVAGNPFADLPAPARPTRLAVGWLLVPGDGFFSGVMA
ncbi:MAG: hypothetical protein EA381_17860 [Planctomycetaceae bacterium]|nr:MAG: hypothetical protein EA381_17860 [Planctomycetaceae bacterium]